MSYQIYRGAPVRGAAANRAEEAWSLIPASDMPLEPFELDDLNWFVDTSVFIETRVRRIEAVLDALARVSRGESIPAKSVSTRYAEGLPGVDPEARRQLGELLSDFVDRPT